MRVLIVTQYFPPEAVAASHRLLSFARAMTRRGHEVVVVTEKPNHPDGVIWEDFKGGFSVWKEVEGIPVLYTWVYTRPSKTIYTRMSFYLTFMLSSVFSARKVKGKFDVVIASSPPLFVGISGWLISKMKRAKYVFDVRDLWPDVIIETGEIRSKSLGKWAHRFERFLYRRADGITATTKSFVTDIRERVSMNTPVRHIANGTVQELIEQDDSDAVSVRKELGIDDKYVVTYAGNIGLCQGLEHIIDAAVLMKQNPEVLFLIVGGGAMKDRLVAYAEDQKVKNVRFEPHVSMNRAASILAASDALLVSLGENDIYRKFIPSKLFDSMASARPVLLSVDGEAREILEDANAGLYYPACDSRGLVECIMHLVSNPEEARQMAQEGRSYVRENYLRTDIAVKLVEFAEEIAGQPSPAREPAAVPVVEEHS